MKTRGPAYWEEPFSFADNTRDELSGIVSEADAKQRELFIATLQRRVESWISHAAEWANWPDQGEEIEQAEGVSRAAKVLIRKIHALHYFTDESIQQHYSMLHADLDFQSPQSLLEPLDRLRVACNSMINDHSSSAQNPGQKKYEKSKTLAHELAESITSAGVAIPVSRQEGSKFVEFLTVLLGLEKIQEAALSITPVTHHNDLQARFQSDTHSIAVGMARSYKDTMRQKNTQ